MTGLAHRQRRPEIMDQPGLDPAEHAAALRGLGRINLLSRSGAALWRSLVRQARQRARTALRVLDVASGGGDVPITLARRARRAGLPIQIDGCDVSPRAVAFAREAARAAGVDVGFFECDALADSLPKGYDVITSTLFLHHLDAAEAVDFLRRLGAAAGQGVLIDDLVRSRWGLTLARLGCRLLTGSRVVHHDGPASVEAAFTPREALALAATAGMTGASITRHWPQRFLLAWTRP